MNFLITISKIPYQMLYQMDTADILCQAIQDNNYVMVYTILPNIAADDLQQLNEKHEFTNIACKLGYWKILKLLLDSGCKIHIDVTGSKINKTHGKIHYFSYDLAEAFHNKQNHIINNLITGNYLPPDDLSILLLTTIFYSRYNNNFEYAKFLIDTYIDTSDINLVIYTYRSGQTNIFRYLVEKKINIDYSIGLSNPLSDAIASDDIDMVKEVINANIDISKYYHTCYKNYFNSQSSFDIIEYMEQNYGKKLGHLIDYNDRLRMACFKNDIKSIKAIFKNTKQHLDDNMSAYTIAIYNKKPDIAKYIRHNIKKKIYNYKILLDDENNNIAMPYNCCIYDYRQNDLLFKDMCLYHKTNIVRSLLHRNVSQDMVTKCFIKMILFKYHKIIKIFLEENILISDYTKILEAAIFNFNYTVLNYLISKKVDFSAALFNLNIDGPISSIIKMMKFLIRNGSNIQHISDGQTLIGKIVRHYDYHSFYQTQYNNSNYEIYNNMDEKVLAIIKYLIENNYQFSNIDKLTWKIALENNLSMVAQYLINSGLNIDTVENTGIYM